MNEFHACFRDIRDYMKTTPIPLRSEDDRENRRIGFATDCSEDDPRFRRWSFCVRHLLFARVIPGVKYQELVWPMLLECLRTASGREIIARTFFNRVSDQDWVIVVHMETPEGRTKLAKSLFQPAQNRLDFVIGKKRRWAEGGYGLREMIDSMTRIKNALTGEEEFDRTRFFSLYGDLRATQDEIEAVRNGVKKA